MRAISIIFTVALCTGCSIPINLPEGVAEQIPDGANQVEIITDQSAGDLFQSIRDWLPAKGYPIENANDVTRMIETDTGDIGQRTSMKIRLQVSTYERGSRLEAIGLWSSDVEESTVDVISGGVSAEGYDWSPAVWQGQDRSSYAYSRLIAAFYDYPFIEMRYVKQ